MLLDIPVLLWSWLIWRLHSVDYVRDIMWCPGVADHTFFCRITPKTLFPRFSHWSWIIQVGQDAVSLFPLRATCWRWTEFVLQEHGLMKDLLTKFIKCFFCEQLLLADICCFLIRFQLMFNHVPVCRWAGSQSLDSTTARRSLCLWGCIHWRVCSRSIGPLESVGEGEEEKRDIFR